MKLKLVMALALVASFSSLNAHAAAKDVKERDAVEANSAKDPNKAVRDAYKPMQGQNSSVVEQLKAKSSRRILDNSGEASQSKVDQVVLDNISKMNDPRLSKIAKDSSLSTEARLDQLAQLEKTAISQLAELEKEKSLNPEQKLEKRAQILKDAKERIRKNCKELA